MKVYVVVSGEYSDTRNECVFTDKKKAELFCAVHNKDCYDNYVVEEFETDEINLTVSEEKGEVGYYYTVFIDIYSVPESCVDKEPRIYAIDGPLVVFRKPNKIEKPYSYRYEANIWLPEANEQKAEKIAYDMLDEYRAKEEGLV